MHDDKLLSNMFIICVKVKDALNTWLPFSKVGYNGKQKNVLVGLS